VLLQEQITGYELKAVRTYFRDRLVPTPQFWELVVTGWGGIAAGHSGIGLLSECDYCGHRVYSCFDRPQELIDPSQWDTSDIFMVWPLPRYIFVTNNVQRIIAHYQLSGIEVIPLAKLDCRGGTLTPGRLSYWMPYARAQKIGTALDIT
jgi:hypothetical protein